MQDQKTEIDNLADAMDMASQRIKNAGTIIAEQILGSEGTNIEKRVLANTYTDTQQATYDRVYGDLTGKNINKASGADNKVYQDIVKDLNTATNGQYVALTEGNAVLGTDKNRKIVVLDTFNNNKKVTLDATEVAALQAGYEAQQKSIASNYSATASNITSTAAGTLGVSEELVNKMFSEGFDVNQLTKEEYNAISAAMTGGSFSASATSIISDADAKALADKTAAEFITQLETEIGEWDPQKAANNIKTNWENSIAGGASAVDVTTDAFKAYTEQLEDNNALLTDNDEITIAAAKAHFDLTRALTDLYGAIDENEQLLRD